MSARTDRASKASAAALLMHERRARAVIERRVDDASDRLTADLARRRDEKRAAALVAVAAASRLLASDLRGDIVRSRQSARAAAASRLGAELAAAGLVAGILARRAHESRLHEDDALAQSAAGSLSAQWQGLAMAIVIKADREGANLATSLKDVTPRTRWRADRTATTEVASAYNDEHARALEEARKQEPALFAGVQIVRVWSAVLDRRTCPECAARDGQIITGDKEPPLHAMCRCISIAMPMSDAVDAAA